MRISDWSSDVCSSDLLGSVWPEGAELDLQVTRSRWEGLDEGHGHLRARKVRVARSGRGEAAQPRLLDLWLPARSGAIEVRSEEHTSELQSLMRISYAVFCLKKKKKNTTIL